MAVGLEMKGPCTVKFGGATIGQTEGDVVLKYSPEWRMFKPDQSLGPQDAFIISEAVEIVIPLVPRRDTYDLARAHAFPAGLTRGTTKVSSPLNTTLSAAEAAGQTDLAVTSETNATAGDVLLIDGGTAKAEIRIVASATTGSITVTEPLAFAHDSGATVVELDADPKLLLSVGNNRDNVTFGELLIDPQDGSPDIKIFKALCTGEVELAYKKEEETIVELTYTGVEDTSLANGRRLFAIGDQTVS